MSRNKKTAGPPGGGGYRTLVVTVDPEQDAPETPDPAVTVDAGVPDALREKMARLDLSDLDPESERRRRAAAAPESADQQRLVDYFDGRDPFAEPLIDLYLSETRSGRSNDMLWMRYHHQGNRRLETLIVACLERHPTDAGLLYDLAHLSRFLGDAAAGVVERYCRALLRETRWPRLRALAEDICDHEPLMTPEARALFRERLAGTPEKRQLLENTMSRHE